MGDIGSVSAMGKDSKIFDKTAEVDKTTDFVFKELRRPRRTERRLRPLPIRWLLRLKEAAAPASVSWAFLLIIIVIAIVAVGVTLFLMHRKNNGGGGSGGKAPYNGGRKSSAYNGKPGGNGAPQSRATRKPAAPPRQQAPKGKTKFGDRNKF